MGVARSFRDLIVYKQAHEVARQVFEITKTFPREERYSMTDQIRRSSRAVCAMIAAAWARRRYRAAFVSKLDEALEEDTETQSWLDQAVVCRYISQTQFQALDAQCQSIGAQLNRMMQTADAWCKFAPDTLGRIAPLGT
jgi:four helix bundle protein